LPKETYCTSRRRAEVAGATLILTVRRVHDGLERRVVGLSFWGLRCATGSTILEALLLEVESDLGGRTP
jgi:hypothetical protein